MKRILILLAFILATTLACQVNSGGNATETKTNLIYFQDPRTNLCFAQTVSMTYGGIVVVSITYVPCDSIPKDLLSY